MSDLTLQETIAAIITPLGESGIGVIRISGKDALSIADTIFLSPGGKKPSECRSHTAYHGWIAKNQGAAIIDEVLLTVFRAPKSYTGEDCVEISCHGSILGLRAVLDLVLSYSCRLAEPGEFTRRAFLSGKLDLSQAEAVSDIISARTDAALRQGVRQLRGALSLNINYIRNALLGILSVIEASIDFPEEEPQDSHCDEVAKNLKQACRQLDAILSTASQGRILREGINVVICGKPNVGKSSLLNMLLQEERAIVTPVAGTTRDAIDETIDIQGIPIHIIDTAGIIEPRDLVEKKAVQRTKHCLASADLVLLVFDGNKRTSKDDEMLMKKLKRKKTVAVINKIDLPRKIETQGIKKHFSVIVEISAKKHQNIRALEEAIKESIGGGIVEAQEPSMVSNIRHIRSLSAAKKSIVQAVNSLDNNLPPEFVAEDVKGALGHLDAIVGKSFSEELLDTIFSKFCIGK
ncbi:MAG: tRNA uridine-5-carboxymethylaminomethyl(34) synthesis GTPase MnmE [Candidatus Omnitrophota bacterium]|nr:MAG: tRNA uridine-5-carboxymethylaminomethyl(34) synthesis GTPase MnmE [Candidatus Omnitrophota bacterium]